MCLLPIGPGEGVNCGHVSVAQVLDTCSACCLFALTSTVNTSVFLSSVFAADSGVRGNSMAALGSSCFILGVLSRAVWAGSGTGVFWAARRWQRGCGCPSALPSWS